MKARVEYEFLVKGRRIRATREGVERALEGVEPEKIRVHWVTVGGRQYPVRQAFTAALGIEREAVRTTTARRVLQRLGFEVYTGKARRRTRRAGTEGQEAGGRGGVRPRFPYASWRPAAAEVERLDLGAIELRWCEWHRWEDLVADDRGGRAIAVPQGSPGVYEAKVEGEPELLVIGKAADLWIRVRQGLVRGHTGHVAGAKIRANEDLSRVLVRWAATDRPAAAEEALHRQHERQFGSLPKYTEHT